MNKNLSASIFILVMSPITQVHAQVAISEDGVTFPDDTNPVTALQQYEIGDVGPAGGWVFHVTADGLHGLEAAPLDQSAGAEWGCAFTELPGAELTAIGTGSSNTNDIVNGCSTTGIAAAVAVEYVSPSGYFDWHLPSKDELDLMYVNLHQAGLGVFVSVGYWSSSEYGGNSACLQDFSNGNQACTTSKVGIVGVRAVRVF